MPRSRSFLSFFFQFQETGFLRKTSLAMVTAGILFRFSGEVRFARCGSFSADLKLLLQVDITFQGVDIFLEGLSSFFGNSADGSGLAPEETLLDIDVSSTGKFLNLNTQISGCRFCLLSEIYKISFIHIHQNRHHRKP